MSVYPTEKQIKYINDYLESIYCKINYILDSSYEIEFKKKFNTIKDNKEVNDLFNYIELTEYILGKVCQSINNKHIIEFKHITTKDEFIKRYEADFKCAYKELCEYVNVPKYNTLVDSIIIRMKQ